MQTLIDIFSFLSASLTMTMVGKVLSLLIMVGMVMAFWRANNNPNSSFNFMDMFVDNSGKIGTSKMRLNLAFIVTTWVLIYYTLNGQLSEWLFAAYIAAFVYDQAHSRKNPTIESPSDDITVDQEIKSKPFAPILKTPVKQDDLIPSNLPDIGMK